VYIWAPANPHPYFADKLRRFEFQLQGQFTRHPPGNVWFGAELARPFQLGRLRQMAAGVLLKFIQAFGRGLHYSFGTRVDDPAGAERPHLVFPLFSAMDRVCITPPGETPPPLGSDFPAAPNLVGRVLLA
jgi:hypothetical protein